MVIGDPYKFGFLIERVEDWEYPPFINGLMFLYLNKKAYPKELVTTALSTELPELLDESSPLCSPKEDKKLFYMDSDERFDLIVSNPPYIRSEVIPSLAAEVSVYEPRLALDGGEDGLYFYRKIIPGSVSFLVTGGMLFLEIGSDQAEEVSALMRNAGFYEVRTIRDYGGNDRIVCGIKSIHQDR